MKATQTIPVEFLDHQRTNKKARLPKLCKICYGEEEEDHPENPLVQPCKCSGTLKYIHLNCLKQWINTKSYNLIRKTNEEDKQISDEIQELIVTFNNSKQPLLFGKIIELFIGYKASLFSTWRFCKKNKAE